jgi:hypothetical protein
MFGARAVALLALAMLAWAQVAFCGPDPNPIAEHCASFRQMSREDRKALRSAVQAVQSLSSIVAQAKWGRLQEYANTTQQLEGWLAGNKTIVQQRDSSGKALSCLSSRLDKMAFQSRPMFSIMLNYFKR